MSQAGSRTTLRTFCAVAVSLSICIAPTAALPARSGSDIRTDVVSNKNAPPVYGDRSLESLNTYIRANPNRADGYYRRARYFSHQEMRDKAIQDCTAAIRLDPTYGEAYILRAEMNVLLANADKAVPDVDKAIALYPKWTYALGERARLKRQLEDYVGAISDAKAALSLDPRDCRTIGELAAAYDAIGDHKKALDVASTNLTITQDDSPNALSFAYHDRGWFFAHAYQFSQAELDLRNALLHRKNDAQALHYLAIVYAMQNDLKRAQETSQQAGTLERFPPRGYRFRAEMYRAAGEWQRAIENYNRSTSMEPNYGPGFWQRGIAKMGLGDWEGAKKDFATALARNPKSAVALSYLAVVEDALDDPKESQQNLDELVKYGKNGAIVYVNRARIELHHGHFVDALKHCNQAIQQDAYLPDAYATRAIVLDCGRHAAQAKSDREKAVQLSWHEWKKPLPVSKESAAFLTAELPALTNIPLGPISPTEMSFNDQHLTIQQRWILASSDLFTDCMFEKPRTKDRMEILPVFMQSPSNIRIVKHLLKEWHIQDRPSLDKVLASISTGPATRGQFAAFRTRVSKMSPSELESYRQDPLNFVEATRADIVLKFGNKLGKNDVDAFDYVRYIGLCRLAVCAGLLSETEFWPKVRPIAHKLQASYNSWQDMAFAFAIGRMFFFSGASKDQKDFDDSVVLLLGRSDSPWHQLAWNTPGI